MSKNTADQARQAREEAQQEAAENGVVNPSGVYIAAYTPLYLALVPVTSFVTKPNGVLESLVRGLTKLIPGGVVPENRTIPALSTLYLFYTFGLTGVLSVTGLAMSREGGLPENNPREFIAAMRGLPQRLRSAHCNLMENFSGFALAAALTQVLAPGDRQTVNLLGLHVVLKALVYYPAYIADAPPARSLSHIAATASLINVCWRLALGA